MTKRSIVVAIMTIILALSLMFGATYALFTSNSSVNIAVTSGIVKIDAVIDDATLVLISDGQGREGTFANGGTASLVDNVLTLSNVTPGDKVEFKINIKNYSNVKVKYMTEMSLASGDEALKNALVVAVNGGISDWTSLEPDATPATPTPVQITVTVELPKSADNSVQNMNAQLAFVVKAVQGNADTSK